MLEGEHLSLSKVSRVPLAIPCLIILIMYFEMLGFPDAGLRFEEAKAASGQAKAGASRPSRAGTALGPIVPTSAI